MTLKRSIYLSPLVPHTAHYAKSCLQCSATRLLRLRPGEKLQAVLQALGWENRVGTVPLRRQIGDFGRSSEGRGGSARKIQLVYR